MIDTEELLFSEKLDSYAEEISQKVAELSSGILINGEVKESKELLGNLLNHIVTIIDITNFLYGQICNLEHRNTCNERMKKLGDRSYKYDSSNKTISAMNNKGESND